MPAPSSQKAGDRPISFVLADRDTGELTGFPLVIRPEDLTRSAPSRLTVAQTLGGAFIDNFGPGLATIQISGHTGWRGGRDMDGAAAFIRLKETVFDAWHARRAQKVADGRDPNGIRLIFSDALDQFVNEVAPQSFTLKRNRSRPLLSMYQISMVVVSEDVDPAIVEQALNDYERMIAAEESLEDSVREIKGLRGFLKDIVGPDIYQAFQDVVDLATEAAEFVGGLIDEAVGFIDGVVGEVIGIASDLAQVARNAIQIYVAVNSLPDLARYYMQVGASAFDNLVCLFTNALQRARFYPDYSPLYGASLCSSTAGGAPLSALRLTNAFDELVPVAIPGVTISRGAASSIAAIKGADPVLRPMQTADLGSRLSAISSGVEFA